LNADVNVLLLMCHYHAGCLKTGKGRGR